MDCKLICLALLLTILQCGNAKRGFGFKYLGTIRQKSRGAYEEHHYYANWRPRTWASAANACKSIFGPHINSSSLLEINDEYEWEGIKSLLKYNGAFDGDFFWSNGVYNGYDMRWEWEMSSTPFYTSAHWLTRYPINYTTQKMGVLKEQGSYGWATATETSLQMFICESNEDQWQSTTSTYPTTQTTSTIYWDWE